ncbi:MAG: MlaD family protein [bacterium]|nr:MlaD family protein [bacterium]
MGNHKKSYTELKVGIFTLFGLLILIFIIISIGDFHIYQKGYTINILFNKIEGLEIASPIRLSGMEVGEVKEIIVDTNKIRVVAWVRSDAPIRADSQITINSLGIIGEKYIDITRGSPSARLLKNEDTIVGIDPVSVGSLLFKTEEVILSLERATGRIEEILQGSVNKLDINKIVKTTSSILNNTNTIITENRQNIKKTFTNLDNSFINLNNSLNALANAAKTTSNTIRHIEKNIDNLFKDNAGNIKTACAKFKDTSVLLMKKILSISTNLEKVINSIDQNLAKTINNIDQNLAKVTNNMDQNLAKVTNNIDQLIDKNKGNLNTTLKNYEKSSLQLIEISNSLKSVISEIEKGKGLLGKISKDDKVAANLEEIIYNLNELSKDIKNHPWKLLRK